MRDAARIKCQVCQTRFADVYFRVKAVDGIIYICGDCLTIAGERSLVKIFGEDVVSNFSCDDIKKTINNIRRT